MYAAGNSHAVTENARAVDNAVVPNVAVGANNSIGTDNGSMSFAESAIYNHVFADNAVVAYGADRVLAFPTEILWVCPDDCSLVYFYILAQNSAAADACIGHNFAVIAYHGIAVYESERVDRYPLAYFCRRVYMC